MSKNDDLVRRELTIAELQAAHVERQDEWCPDQKPDLSFRGNEMAGEVGEACNVIKKLERERQGWRGSRATKEQLAEELADVVHTAVLCAITAGVELQMAVVAKFNSTSEKNGLSTMLSDAIERGAAQGSVTDEMVTVAIREYVGRDRYARDYEYVDAQLKPQMRVALEAALVPTPPAPAPDAGEEFRDMADAPKDGTMLRLLVVPNPEAWTPFDDSHNPYETIGFNNLANTDEDRWEFVGWDWNHDCFVTGHGEVIGWAPFAPSPTPQPPAVEAEAVERLEVGCDRISGDEEEISHPNGRYVRFTDHQAALKAKTDEIERLTAKSAAYEALLSQSESDLEAAEASNKALREGLERAKRVFETYGWDDRENRKPAAHGQLARVAACQIDALLSEAGGE